MYSGESSMEKFAILGRKTEMYRKYNNIDNTPRDCVSRKDSMDLIRLKAASSASTKDLYAVR